MDIMFKPDEMRLSNELEHNLLHKSSFASIIYAHYFTMFNTVT